VHPRLKSGGAGARDPAARLAEAIGLAEAIELAVTHAEIVTVGDIRPATLFGSGTVERLGRLVAGAPAAEAPDEAETPRRGRKKKALEVQVVVVDAPLSPVQQRNLERAWNCKVVDRTGLILEIFGARARTREGRLQVELAALTYQKSRLVRSWTHLERQRGGFGFLGGPGETQIETDRRIIGERILRLKREIGSVKRTRQLHRRARRRVPYPVVALVGYTNAGKSTLFNQLTKADVVARDQLFATLDPTMRGLALPSGRMAILSDTVGFISDLPHELVTAFHATLEEVCEADIILHVRDVAHPESEAQKMDVLAVLRELGLEAAIEQNLIEVLNKIDLLAPENREALLNRIARANTPMVALSAITGEGCSMLLALLDDRLSTGLPLVEIAVAPEDGAALAWLYKHGEVVERHDSETAIRLKVRLDSADAARFARRRAQRPA
jgi:GTP-binding protein HflX